MPTCKAHPRFYVTNPGKGVPNRKTREMLPSLPAPRRLSVVLYGVAELGPLNGTTGRRIRHQREETRCPGLQTGPGSLGHGASRRAAAPHAFQARSGGASQTMNVQDPRGTLGYSGSSRHGSGQEGLLSPGRPPPAPTAPLWGEVHALPIAPL